MLQTEQPPSDRSFDSVVDTQSASSEAFKLVIDFALRQYLVIALVIAAGLVVGFVYLLTTPSSYTATATMIIDTNKVQLFQQQSMFSQLPLDPANVESQVEILKSESIALAVIKKLNLTEDPEFVSSGGGLIGTLLSGIESIFLSDAPSSEFVLTRAAVNTFESRLKVQRVGLTYVILISFRSFSPDRAAQIANAVADAYIDDQLEAKYQAARRAGTWLQERLTELREQASTAERTVVAFKNQNDMVDAGGRSMNEQQLAELNSGLVLAQSKIADARSKVDRVQEVLKSNSPEATVVATVSDSLQNAVITKLRSQYLDLSAREADWAARYGHDHLAVVNLRNQMAEIQNSIRNELQRIAETYKSDLEIATQNAASVQKQLSEAVAQSQVTNQAQVKLRELESNSQTYRALYDSFLQRYMESVQQQSFPITDARVISAATRPLTKSNPKTTLVLGLAALVGAALGIAAGAWRDFTDRVFRTAKEVESLLQLDCISLVPSLAETASKNRFSELIRTVKLAGERRGIKFIEKRRETKFGDQERDIKIFDSRLADPRSESQIVKCVTSPEGGQQTIAPTPGIFSTVVESPFSALSESIRSIKVAIDLSSTVTGGRIIGFTSSIPNEGKSSISGAVARLVALTGARTLLIDCDLRNPSLSRLLSPKARSGLLEVVSGQTTFDNAILVDLASKLNFLPAGMKARVVHSSEILASEQTRKLFETLRDSYDYIFVDFAPLMPIVDVRASMNLVDSYIYIIAWGQTRINFVEQALRSAKGVYGNLLGAVLNKVDLRSLGRYDGLGGDYYHHRNYDRYGYTE